MAERSNDSPVACHDDCSGPKNVAAYRSARTTGTGCGWCIPFLIKIAEDPGASGLAELTPGEYEAQRTAFPVSGTPKNTFRIDDEA